ncbi:CHASE2 domain-containing protein [bacterium]|nr:CHASE2 domain-containing protein [bacterium]
MFKKYFEYILALALSIILTGTLYLFLSNISQIETEKSKLQIALENVSHRWNDLFYTATVDKKPNQDVILLAIDEESIIEVGRWPWSRTIINKITEELVKYDIKTLAYDIIFSENESDIVDQKFAKTIAKSPEKLTLGTFSDFPITPAPYQDYCMTQAFLYTGGGNLAKINPFFSVDDENNKYEDIEFNQLFQPIFKEIDRGSLDRYLSSLEKKQLQDLTQYQLNTLNFYKAQRIYDYCHSWLTNDDSFSYKMNPELKAVYLQLFKATGDEDLAAKISLFKKETLHNPIPQYAMWKQNIPELQNVALYTASFVASPDTDGIIRNYPMISRTGNQLGTSYIPSIALQSYLAATGYQALFKFNENKNAKIVSRIEVKDVSGETEKTVTNIPINNEGKLLINYYGKRNSIIYVPAKEILNDSDKIEYTVRPAGDNTSSANYRAEKFSVNKAEFLKGKNIIFGATAIGIYDIRTTPNDINYPGPEIHASVLSNLFNAQFLSYDRNELSNSPIIFFVFILITLLIFVKSGIRATSILFVTISVILFYIENLNYRQGVLFQSSFLYFVLLFIAFFVTFIYKYFFQSRKSKEIKMAFSKYVSKDVVEEILRNESSLELRGQKLFMSVYFSDIRGFTSFSEKMDPVDLSNMLNKYFTPMSAIITRHQGTIDKYIGDAIMAMFGAPINYQDHAFKACHAALDCIKALEKINEEFAAKSWPRIDIGIGINTGYMNAGNIGSETIQNYTVIGDSVNLGSRLESLTKEYGVKIIISEFTYDIVKESFNCRELDKVNVKGKKEPVTIYELISTK